VRKTTVGQQPANQGNLTPLQKWTVDAIVELSRASHEQITEEIADAYQLGTFTETRTLNPATATVADVANVLATILNDMKKRGVNRK